MKITIEGAAPLNKFMKEGISTVDLGDQVVISDLLPIIDKKWGAVFPPHIWNKKKHQFRGPVVFVLNDIPVKNMDTPLKDGDHVMLVKALVGG